MLPVAVDLDVCDIQLEARLLALSPEPCKALISNCGSTMFRAIAVRSGMQRIHNHVMFDRTQASMFTPADYGIGTQRKA